MCIRDRDSVTKFPYQLTLGSVSDENLIYRMGLAVGDQCKRCLLYTSDAADERSSVDLGGRRIIKKKNHADADQRSTSQNR